MAELHRSSATRAGETFPTGLDLLVSAAESIEGSVSPDLRSDADYLSSPPLHQRALFDPSPNCDLSVADAGGRHCEEDHKANSEGESSRTVQRHKKRAQIARSCARCRDVSTPASLSQAQLTHTTHRHISDVTTLVLARGECIGSTCCEICF